MSYYAFEGLIPVVHPTAFVHPSAVLIGDVIVGAGVYIGPLASLRGDYGRLIVQAGANIQDGCIMHGYCDTGNDSNLLIVFYVQIMPDDFVMQLHRF